MSAPLVLTDTAYRGVAVWWCIVLSMFFFLQGATCRPRSRSFSHMALGWIRRTSPFAGMRIGLFAGLVATPNPANPVPLPSPWPRRIGFLSRNHADWSLCWHANRSFCWLDGHARLGRYDSFAGLVATWTCPFTSTRTGPVASLVATPNPVDSVPLQVAMQDPADWTHTVTFARSFAGGHAESAGSFAVGHAWSGGWHADRFLCQLDDHVGAGSFAGLVGAPYKLVII